MYGYKNNIIEIADTLGLLYDDTEKLWEFLLLFNFITCRDMG